VIGRDHLDTGSVASPYGESEGMLDGSDAGMGVARYAGARYEFAVETAYEQGNRIPVLEPE